MKNQASARVDLTLRASEAATQKTSRTISSWLTWTTAEFRLGSGSGATDWNFFTQCFLHSPSLMQSVTVSSLCEICVFKPWGSDGGSAARTQSGPENNNAEKH